MANPPRNDLVDAQGATVTLSRQDVEKVATLARLDLEDSAIQEFTTQFNAVLGYFAQLDGVATEGIEPLSHVCELTNVFSADEVRPGLDREAALGNAPSRDGSCFRVPPMMG